MKALKTMVVATVLVGLVTLDVEARAGLNSQIFLAPSANFSGVKVKARYRDNGRHRDFRVEAENVRLAPGTRLVITVRGATVGTMVVTNLRTARFNVTTELRQTVPEIARGSVVQVKTQAGAIIASGTF